AVVIAIAFSSTLSDLGKRVSRKYFPVDPYQLAEHRQNDLAVETNLRARPKDAAAWLEAARFELADNSPYGAAHCLHRAKALGAAGSQVAEVEGELKEVQARWTALYEALLANGRFEDGNNVYGEIYPILDRFRQAKSDHPLHGKARADYDLLKAHLLLKEGRRDEARMLLEELREQSWALQPLANYLHAKTYVGEADSAEARGTFQAFLLHHPKDRLVPYALYELGKLALTDGDKRSAQGHFQRIVKDHPSSPQVGGALLALNDMQRGHMPEAPAPAAPVQEEPNAIFDLAGGESAEPDTPKDGATPAGEPAPAAPGPMTDGSLLPPQAQEAAAKVAPTEQLDPQLIPQTAQDWELYGGTFHEAKDSAAVQARAAAVYDATVKLETKDKPAVVWGVLSPAAALGW
ncbi:MAG TPA: tetratricopeptide repeat protein, partial [bacterium]|nr:tetratricopeptide repeat protein [bacterium]